MVAFQRTTIIAGFFIFLFAIFGVLYQEGIMIIIFTLFIPGPLLGLIICFFKKSTLLPKLLFVLSVSLIYLITLYMIDIKNIDYKFSPIRILLASMVSLILLQFLFDIIFKFRITLKDAVLKPAVFGFISAFLSTLTGFLLEKVHTTGWLRILTWFGLFSIFPLWFFLFSRHLIKTGKIP